MHEMWTCDGSVPIEIGGSRPGGEKTRNTNKSLPVMLWLERDIPSEREKEQEITKTM